MTEIPGYLRPFVLPTTEVQPERTGPVDLYLPESDSGPVPVVVILHGGPMPPDMRPTPRDWPVFRGYGALMASLGLAAAVVDHRLHIRQTPDGVVLDYPVAADDVTAAVDAVRADPRIDGDRVVVWFFSGGALLSADWLHDQPAWLRGVALTYPMLAPMPGWPVDDRFRPAQAVTGATTPIVLTRVGRERPEIAETVEQFLTAATGAGVTVKIVDALNGQHSFDTLDDTDESRQAIRQTADRIRAMVA